MTLRPGTDRAAAALEVLGEPFDCVLNIQGDEPAMHPETVASLVALMAADPSLSMGTAACPFGHPDELFNPNAVKVVVDDRSRALYFSRSPITRLAPHPLEQVEMLEQLRALAAGIPIGVAETPHLSLGVDVPGDVPLAETLLRERGLAG